MAGARSSAGLGRVEFPLWGGSAVVAVTEPAGLEAAVAHVRRTVEAFDEACSSFRRDSELTLLNSSPREEVAVSSLLLAAVREALRAARLTGGAVDPTVGHALVAHRITPTLGHGALRIAPAPGYQAVRLDEAERTIRRPAGVRLDLGATTKALAADIAAAGATAAAGCGVLVALCGDIAATGTPPAGGWKIRVTDDHRDGQAPGQTVTIRSGGLATSSVAVRRHGSGRAAVHHLIDPATGRPVDGPWRTVSVSADSCLDANAASTAAVVLGRNAPRWLRIRRLPARLVNHEGEVCHLVGWPREGDEL